MLGVTRHGGGTPLFGRFFSILATQWLAVAFIQWAFHATTKQMVAHTQWLHDIGVVLTVVFGSMTLLAFFAYMCMQHQVRRNRFEGELPLLSLTCFSAEWLLLGLPLLLRSEPLLLAFACGVCAQSLLVMHYTRDTFWSEMLWLHFGMFTLALGCALGLLCQHVPLLWLQKVDMTLVGSLYYLALMCHALFYVGPGFSSDDQWHRLKRMQWMTVMPWMTLLTLLWHAVWPYANFKELALIWLCNAVLLSTCMTWMWRLTSRHERVVIVLHNDNNKNGIDASLPTTLRQCDDSARSSWQVVLFFVLNFYCPAFQWLSGGTVAADA